MKLEFKDKTAAVIGAGRSGIAAARLLKKSGVEVLLSEVKSLNSQTEAELKAASIKFETGGHSDQVLSTDLVVVSPGVRWELPVLAEARKKNIPVIGEMELAYQLTPARIIGITGTNGKSTTTSMLGRILQTAGMDCYIGGNLAPGRPVCELVMDAGPQSFIVAEISTFQLESIVDFKPYIGIITNITPDHLDRHPDFETYAKLKARLLENQSSFDHAVLNADDQQVLKYSSGARAHKIFFSGQRPVKQGTYSDGETIHWIQGQEPIPIMRIAQLLVPGQHNVENVLAAAAAAMILGISPDIIRQGLETFKGVPHRLEEVGIVGGVRYINNSMGTNAAAGVSSLRAFREPMVVIAGGKEKNVDLSDFLKEIAQKAVAAVLIGESKDRIERELSGLGMKNIHKAGSMKEAVSQAAALARPGQLVMLAPGAASFDMFADFEDRGNQFKQAVAGLNKNELP
ncbi:UDP-N-acetylmuramoyl-L-alanine--D-glutamate ligase [candidate division TA06 bacterium]|uniref:UDP-N-acetylmuramoylalanine--D-glutamate ligase n=1 Tax=candidate division TA06 bacterium TaxID=2250710 RepID=A0A933MJD8_UNCT6|nr:UDP-N-acetylmuramoyl-L-alanine--D-glutamate ligase [candidate division TA06 bacterium]